MPSAARGRSGSVATTRVAIGTLLVAPRLHWSDQPASGPRRLVLLGAGQRVETEIRVDLFDAFLRLEPGFYQSRRTGDLMCARPTIFRRLDARRIRPPVPRQHGDRLRPGTLVVMLRMDAWLTVAALAPYPLLVAVARRCNTRAHARPSPSRSSWRTWPRRSETERDGRRARLHARAARESRSSGA